MSRLNSISRCLGGLLLLGGCSALINPDSTRLGDEVEEDGGSIRLMDSGPSLVDGSTPARDATTPPGRDGGMPPARDASTPPGEDGGPPPPPVDAGPCDVAPTCADGTLSDCSGSQPCPLGCAPSGEARCARMVPSNVSADFWRSDAGSVSIEATSGSSLVFDTTVCEASTTASELAMQRGVDARACILMVEDFTIRDGGSLRVTGAFPLVIMATGSVVIESEGVLDVSAIGTTPGPGGGSAGGTSGDPGGGGASGGGPGAHEGTYDDGGGGGGAFCGAGAAGGQGGSASGGEGGEALRPELLQPLRGGAGGGRGNGAFFSGGGTLAGLGGAGGGAVQISALGEIRIDGFILAGGGGGRGGRNGSANFGSGGGGGSGGAVLLEAPSVTLNPDSTAITTSGGGGGGGASFGGDGGNGEDGRITLGRSDGGARGSTGGGGTNYGAAGGAGGGGDALDGVEGQSNTVGGANGGGGGGGAGCVVYRTLDGALPTGASTSTSGSVAPSLRSAPIMLE